LSATLKVCILAILVAATAAYVYLNPPGEMSVAPGTLSGFPMELDGWTGEERSFDEVVVEELGADDMLTRRYVRGRDSVWFVVIFHQNERYGAHDPLVCYRSQGWEVVQEGVTPLERTSGAFDANWVLIRSKNQTRLALYWWYTAGDLATGDRDQFFARMARSGIMSNVTYGAFIRISTVVVDGDTEAARAKVVEFAEAALRDLPSLFDFEPR
jgi:EpsI family protein